MKTDLLRQAHAFVSCLPACEVVPGYWWHNTSTSRPCGILPWLARGKLFGLQIEVGSCVSHPSNTSNVLLAMSEIFDIDILKAVELFTFAKKDEMLHCETYKNVWLARCQELIESSGEKLDDEIIIIQYGKPQLRLPPAKKD